MSRLLVAVDVGTESARAGVVTAEGALLSRAERPLTLHRSGAQIGEYASEQIWRACCGAVRDALTLAGTDGSSIAGIGFDATCSLVMLDAEGRALPVGDSGGGDGPVRDTIAWFDHRALAEAREATTTGHEVLGYSGGVISPEMEVPKLMWLKRHLPKYWARAGHLFDLADFLTWKATGALDRSQSTLTSKWAYLGHETQGWRHDFYDRLGIGDMFVRGRLPERATPIGTCIGTLLPDSAEALGLSIRCKAAIGMIDAHAGALGILGEFAGTPEAAHRSLGLVAGTSSCVVALSGDKRCIRGIWGPYCGAVLPDLWLNEGGQSATGALLDHVIRWHSAGGEPTGDRHDAIIARIADLRAEHGAAFAARLHVLPDFHGNRSPLAAPDAIGVISGLTLDSSFDSLCALYWRTAVAIALGLRQILETLARHGYETGSLHVTGGHTRNGLLMDLYKEITGCTVITRSEADAVLIGNAMTAAAAAGLHPSLAEAAKHMCGPGIAQKPVPNSTGKYERDYKIFLQMQQDRQRIEAI